MEGNHPNVVKNCNRLVVNQCNVLLDTNIPKGVSNKGKATWKKSKTGDSGKTKRPQSQKKLVMIIMQRRSQRHVKKTCAEREDEKMHCHRL